MQCRFIVIDAGYVFIIECKHVNFCVSALNVSITCCAIRRCSFSLKNLHYTITLILYTKLILIMYIIIFMDIGDLMWEKYRF